MVSQCCRSTRVGACKYTECHIHTHTCSDVHVRSHVSPCWLKCCTFAPSTPHFTSVTTSEEASEAGQLCLTITPPGALHCRKDVTAVLIACLEMAVCWSLLVCIEKGVFFSSCMCNGSSKCVQVSQAHRDAICF